MVARVSLEPGGEAVAARERGEEKRWWLRRERGDVGGKCSRGGRATPEPGTTPVRQRKVDVQGKEELRS